MKTSIAASLLLYLGIALTVSPAEAQQKVVVIPLYGDEPAKLVPGNTATVVSRDGFSARCTQWSGDLCQKAWMGINEKAINAPDPDCIDQPAKLRPLWFGRVDDQAATFCWIATGDPTFVSASEDGIESLESGWNYGENADPEGDFTTDCSSPPNYRRYSRIAIPGLGEQIWSFDNFSEARFGDFSTYECNW